MASNAFNLSNVALTSSSSSNATIVTFTGNLLAQSLEVQGSYVPPNGIYLPAANTIGFTTGSSERVRVTSAGNVQIGTTTQTTNPTAGLVINNINGGGTEWVNNNNGGGNVSALSTGGLAFSTFTGAVGDEVVTERMRITSAGLVGIGTSPNKLLQVYRNNTDQDAQVQIEQAGAGSPTLGFLKTGVFAWLTGLYNSDNSYRIAASGTDLNTSTALTISSAGAIKFGNLYGVTVTTPRNVFVDASGNIGGISSIRASKTNIASMPDANWVLDLNPVTFNYRKKDKDGNFTDDFDLEKMYGLIAEDAATVNPDICIYNEVDGEQKLASIHYDRLIAPIIKVLKDQQAMIEALQAQVTELQRR